MFCSHELKKKKGNSFDLQAELGNGLRTSTQSLPTHMADVNMGFVSLDANIWNEIGEGLVLCFLFSSLNLKSCVVTPSPDYQYTYSRQEVAAHMHSRPVLNLWTAITSPFHWRENSGRERLVVRHVLLCTLFFIGVKFDYFYRTQHSRHSPAG